ncbi:MAG: class I SAM-dependent RNA methyltransferase, partial [Nitriliruptoraceae bacterium]
RTRHRALPPEPVTVEVDGITHGGEGVARIEGKAVFVPGALPGERVTIRVTDDRRRWARATLLEVHTPAPDRVEPPCPYVPACGGCDLQHVSPAGQLRLKTRIVREQLERIGRVEAPPVQPCRAVGPALGYRAQARLHADRDGNLGFHRAGSDEVVAIDRCLVLTAGAQQLRAEVGDHSGAQEVRIRRFTPHGPGSVVLTPGPGPLELPGGDADLLLTQPDGRTVAMRGDGEVEVEVEGLGFLVPARSFFQPGVDAAAALLDEVLAAAGDVAGALCWDLYSGVGLLALGLARAGAEVVAVEGDELATDAAARNAARNGLALEVHDQPVGRFLRTAADAAAHQAGAGEPAPQPTAALDPPDVVVLDPPRTGAGAEVLTDLARLTPAAIVYVACDPAALARDTRTLAGLGYRLERAQPLDLFPMTHHVEVVASFAPTGG